MRGIPFLLLFLVLSFYDISLGLDFVPRIHDYEGELELNFSYDRDETKTYDGRLMRRDIFLKEKLNLTTRGYIYHPRFITIYLKLSGGLKHEDFRTSASKNQWWMVLSKEYELRTFVLPEHPYNLELFTLRKEPLSRQGLMRISPAVTTTEGGRLRYEKKPLFLNLLYSDTSVNREDLSYNTKIFSSSAKYYKDFSAGRSLSFSGSFTKTDSGVYGNRKHYQLGNGIRLSWSSLDSTLSFDRWSSNSTYKYDSMSWAERLQINLPYNFTAGLSWIFTEDNRDFNNRLMEQQTRNGSLSLSHRLYNSLFSNYRVGFMSTETVEKTSEIRIKADTLNISHYFSTNYRKRIISENFLNSGLSISTIRSERDGGMRVLRENHSAQPGIIGSDEFDLNERNVLIATIEVYVENPDTKILYRLSPITHYQIIVIGDITRIRIIDLPAPVWSNNVDAYNFFVSYSTEAVKADFETENLGYYIRLELLNNLLSPYYSYSRLRTSLKEGVYSGRLPETDTDIFGLQVSRKPCFFSIQYQTVSSNISPSDSWRLEFKYSDDLTDTLSITARLFYQDTDYRKSFMLPEGYSEEIKGIGTGIRKKFPEERLYLALGADYSRRDSRVDSDSYSLDFSASWKTGKLEFAGGVSIDMSKSYSNEYENRKISQLFYINVKRRLF